MAPRHAAEPKPLSWYRKTVEVPRWLIIGFSAFWLTAAASAGYAASSVLATPTVDCDKPTTTTVAPDGSFTVTLNCIGPAPAAPSPSPTASPSASPTASPTPSPSPSVTATSPSPTPTTPSPTATTPSPTPTTTGPPSLLTGCFSRLAACGYPTTSTTGVPGGTVLTVTSGDLTIKTSGAVVQNREIHGCIDVQAPNVIIRNVRVVGPCAYGIQTYRAGGTTTIDRVEVNCTDAHGSGIAGPGFYAHAVYLHDCENGLEINGGSSIVDSVISAREANSEGHGDMIQSQDGNSVLIEHNTFIGVNPLTSSIITNPTLNNNWKILRNFLASGAFTLYCPEQGTNFVVQGNRFYPAKTGDGHSAAYGLTDACNHTGIVWGGAGDLRNYRDDTLQTVNANGDTVN